MFEMSGVPYVELLLRIFLNYYFEFIRRFNIKNFRGFLLRRIVVGGTFLLETSLQQTPNLRISFQIAVKL